MNKFVRPTTAKLVKQAMDQVEAEVQRQGRSFSSAELARLMGQTLNRLRCTPEPDSEIENPDESDANSSETLHL